MNNDLLGGSIIAALLLAAWLMGRRWRRQHAPAAPVPRCRQCGRPGRLYLGYCERCLMQD